MCEFPLSRPEMLHNPFTPALYVLCVRKLPPRFQENREVGVYIFAFLFEIKMAELLLSCRLMSTKDGRADVGVLPEHTWRIPNRNTNPRKVADIILCREKYSCVIQVTLRTK